MSVPCSTCAFDSNGAFTSSSDWLNGKTVQKSKSKSEGVRDILGLAKSEDGSQNVFVFISISVSYSC